MSDARQAQYAETIEKAVDDYWDGDGRGFDGTHAEWVARAVMAVADEERAADRAEIERLRAQVQLMCPHLSLSGAEADLWRCDECGLIGTHDDIEAVR